MTPALPYDEPGGPRCSRCGSNDQITSLDRLCPGCRAAQTKLDAQRPDDIVGHDVVVRLATGLVRHHHWRGNAAYCRRKAMLTSLAERVESITPLTRREYDAAYGTIGRM